MIIIASKKWSLRKKILVAGILLLAILAGIYFYFATETFSDTKNREAAFTVNANDFIKEFLQSDSAANAKYRDKIVTVNGRISEIEMADSTANIKFIDTTTGSFAIFAFQQQHLAEAKSVKAGDSVSIKGSCSGGIYSDILGVEKIDFKRSTLNY
jgi:uncharacterized protein (UPF0333 family)